VEWLLYSLLYHICHNVVSVLQEWLLYSVLYHICHNVVSILQEWFLYSTRTITVEQKQPYDKYDIVKNTATIPVEEKNKL
jgi:membrane protein insertase Oxa1/YidC/SpoIIIJ